MLEKLNVQYFEWRKNHFSIQEDADVILCHPVTAEQLINEFNADINTNSYVLQDTPLIRFRGIKIYRSLDDEKGTFIIS
jgi:hypothetical protein